MQEHTKGELKIVDMDYGNGYIYAAGSCIAKMCSCLEIGDAEQKANAKRLIKCWNEHNTLVKETDQLKAEIADRKEMVDVVHETFKYLGTLKDKIAHLEISETGLLAETHEIRNQWHIDLNDKIAYKIKADMFDEAMEILRDKVYNGLLSRITDQKCACIENENYRLPCESYIAKKELGELKTFLDKAKEI